MSKENKRGLHRPRRETGGGLGGMGPGLFTPDRKHTTLRWSFAGTAASSGTYAETVFSGNGLSDPGLSSSTTQPVGFDQYALWYNRYRVNSSKIKLMIQLASTSATPTATAYGLRIVLYPSNTSAAATTIQEAMAQPRAKFLEVGTVPVMMTMELSSQKALGFNGRNIDATDSAGVAAQPTAQWYWHVGTASGTYTSLDSLLYAQIDYASEFFYRVTQPLSLLEKLQKELFLTVREEMKNRESKSLIPQFVADDENKETVPDVKVVSQLSSGEKGTDGKLVAVKDTDKRPRPLLPESNVLSQSVASARDYAWVKLPTPLGK